MSQPNNPAAVVIDANVLLGICTKEPKEAIARAALASYSTQAWIFHAPNAIVVEFLYVACQKLQTGTLTQGKYEKAIEDFQDYMSGILTPPGGDAALIKQAMEIQRDYGCSHATDCLYIALAEELAVKGVAELVTFDKAIVNQAARNAPTVRVNLLLI